MVSVDAHKIHAILAILLSGPKPKTSSDKSPIEPPPDIGRIMARGRISDGILKKDVIGDRIDEIKSIAPDDFSIAETDKIATSAGKMEITVLIPSSTPSINLW